MLSFTLPLSPPLSAAAATYISPSCSSERQALFKRMAPAYDQVSAPQLFSYFSTPFIPFPPLLSVNANLNDLLSLGQHRVWKRMAVSWSGAKEGDCVLDLCCGTGDISFLLSEKVRFSGKVTGLDFSKEQLSIASTRLESKWKPCYSNIVWMEGDALDLPFPDSYFDAITVGYGLRNVVDRHIAMKEMYRVLKQGSRLSVLDFNKSTSAFTTLFQEWMIDNVVVPVATSYQLTKEYEYLKSSIRDFLTGGELEELAKEVGFANSKHYEMGGGLMGTLVATR